MYLLADFKIFSLALVFMIRTCLGMFLCLRFVELLESVEFIIFIKFQQHFQSFFCHSFSVFFWDFSYHFTGPQIVAVLFIFSLFIFDQFYFENFLLLYLHKAMVFPVVMYGCESCFLGCWKRVFAMTCLLSWQNSVILCHASLCTSRPNSPVTPSVFWLPIFAFQSPMMKRTSFFWCYF